MILVTWGLLNSSINRFRSLVPVGRWLSVYGPRPMLYFAYKNEYPAPSYIASAETVNKTDCTTVGIDSYTPLTDPEIKRSPDSFFTYPILALIHADGRTRTAWFLRGARPQRPCCRKGSPIHLPALIICLDCAKAPPNGRGISCRSPTTLYLRTRSSSPARSRFSLVRNYSYQALLAHWALLPHKPPCDARAKM